MPSGPDRDLNAVLQRVVEQRYDAAMATVAELRVERPDASADDLTDHLMRQCAREMAIGGAMSGGAAASPVAGMGFAVAALGADATYGVARLGEMIMAIGIVHGFEHRSAQERTRWVAAILGASEGAAMGLTGVAATVGARGGARLLSRMPAGAMAGASATSRMANKMMAKRGPWSVAALVPYGIGAGVGAAGNAALAWSVGRAARRYFAGLTASAAGSPTAGSSNGSTASDDEIWDVEVVAERILPPED